MPPSGLVLLLLLVGESEAPPASSPAPWCPFQASSSPGGLCFRLPALGFQCQPRSCTAHRSPGSALRANVLRNGSVLLQWAWPPPGSPPSSPPRGFRLSCSWEGPEARFPCDSVRLGAHCRDYLLPEAHGGLRYRLCLQPLFAPEGEKGGDEASPPECVEFAAEPAGPRDIVVAMAAVGGAICVMLVLICLLVAYLTESLPPARPAGGTQA
ncbi:fibronectin type III domain-containing protein 10 [Anolis carolinensis]|uniref:fibronectin type III domain-containing protein 10 n=1 Tax=Anolis carolinensis TaxID=28377 RepID=UPI002F2B6725